MASPFGVAWLIEAQEFVVSYIQESVPDNDRH